MNIINSKKIGIMYRGILMLVLFNYILARKYFEDVLATLP